jgi:hypothetical protein
MSSAVTTPNSTSPDPLYQQQCVSWARENQTSGTRNALMNWLRRSGHLLKFGHNAHGEAYTREDITHTMMDGVLGGCICIDAKSHDDFLTYYLSAVHSGATLCISELATKPFCRLYLDLDLLTGSALTDDQYTAIIHHFYAVLGKFYMHSITERESCTLVFRRTAVTTVHGSWKTGIHLILPNLIVTKQVAQVIRLLFIQRLTESCDSKLPSPEKSWSNVVDEGPIAKSTGSLRMPYSFKVTQCSVCKRRRNGNCQECNGVTMYDIDSVYFLQDVYVQQWSEPSYCKKQEELRRYFYAHPLSLIKEACISIYGRTAVEPNCDAGMRTYQHALQKKHGGFQEDEKGKRKCLRNGTDVSSDDVHILQRVFQDNLVASNARGASPYASVQVRRVTRHELPEEKRFYTICVAGPGSSFCQNKRGEHLTNSVYFIFTKVGITQRCWCSCDVERHAGKCKTFKSRPSRLPPHIISMFFPTKKIAFPLSTNGVSSRNQRAISKLTAYTQRLSGLLQQTGHSENKTSKKRKRK